jgi:hypothetical protein
MVDIKAAFALNMKAHQVDCMLLGQAVEMVHMVLEPNLIVGTFRLEFESNWSNENAVVRNEMPRRKQGCECLGLQEIQTLSEGREILEVLEKRGLEHGRNCNQEIDHKVADGKQSGEIERAEAVQRDFVAASSCAHMIMGEDFGYQSTLG